MPYQHDDHQMEDKMEKTVKKVCRCENCGNEAEMMITCTLDDNAPVDKQNAAADAASHAHEHRRVKGSAVCSHCGNEADMWIDL